MEKKVKKFLINKDISIKEAIKKLNRGAEKILFVVDENRNLYGALTDGDIRRWILKEGNLNEQVEHICNKNPYYVEVNYNIKAVKEAMLKNKFSCIPVVNSTRSISKLLFWEEVFKNTLQRKQQKKLSLPVVIMAGGKGTRLDPVTKILPKPLIPIGNKSVIEIIIDKFTEYGINKFYISINYKAKIIKSYFEELSPNYSIEYIEEKKPLGTIGGLKLLEKKLNKSFIVTNCDIIIDTDYDDIVEFHNEKRNDITIVASLKNYNIPYGICQIKNGGYLTELKEKPEFNFLVNTGMYILRPWVLKCIPKNNFFQITQLIKLVKENKGKIRIYPISESSWIDTGEWEEYKKALDKIKPQ